MLVDDLKTLLATSFSYYLKTANYHWNIEGEDFIQYHPWLGELYNGVYGSIDQIAEYIRAMQAYTPASLVRFMELTRITDQIEVAQPMALFQQLLADNQIMLDLLNTTFDTATDAVHNSSHNVSASAVLGNISDQKAGAYSGDITITVSSI